MSLTNPFTNTPVLTPTVTNNRYPVSLPGSALVAPSVPLPISYLILSADITNTLSAITTIQTYYSTTNNQFGITPVQYAALNAVYTLFLTLTAGYHTFTIAQLQNIVTVSQMIRSWQGVNINLLTQAQLPVVMGRILSLTLTAPGKGYTAGTYNSIAFAGGSGSFATATFVVGNLSTIASLSVTTSGSGYTAGFYSNVPVTYASTGPIKTLGAITAGSAYTNGTYTNVPLNGGTGSTAHATIIIAGGAVTTVTVTNAGTAYTVADVLTITPSSVGGTGSGFSIPVATVLVGTGTGATANITVGDTGVLATVVVQSSGSGYLAGTYTNVPLNDSFSGASGALGTVVVGVGGGVTSVTVTNGGITADGYTSSSHVQVPSGQLGNSSGSGFVGTVTTVQGVTTAAIVTAGTGYATTDNLTVVNTSIGGAGSGFTMAPVLTQGVTSISNIGGGFNYVVGDVLGVLNTDLNSTSGSGFSATVTALNPIIFKQPLTAFPNGATTLTVNDGYGLVEQPNSGNFWTSDSQNFINWNGLASATIESRSDQLVAVDQIGGGNVVLFGTRSLEYWFDNGTFPLAFARATGQQQDWGLAAKWSRANVQGSLMFLGQNFQGNPEVVWLNGYAPEPVSTSDLESILNTFTVINDAIAFSYNMNGHTFYQITFPTANRSFLYDVDTDIWGEVQSGMNIYNRHLASLGVSYNTGSFVSDCSNGNIYYLDQNNYTDNGSLIRREITSQHIFDVGNEVALAEVFLDMQIGVGTETNVAIGDSANPQITMEVSKDYGNTFQQPRPVSMGLIGQYRGPRVVWRRIGSARDFVFRFVMTSAVPFVINYGSALFRETNKD